MLDVNDFITERGGNPELIRESQRRRFANVEIVDEVIALFEVHRKSTYRFRLPSNFHSRFIFTNAARYSPIQRQPDQGQNQRRPEADRDQEEGRLYLYARFWRCSC